MVRNNKLSKKMIEEMIVAKTVELALFCWGKRLYSKKGEGLCYVCLKTPDPEYTNKPDINELRVFVCSDCLIEKEIIEDKGTLEGILLKGNKKAIFLHN